MYQSGRVPLREVLENDRKQKSCHNADREQMAAGHDHSA